MPFCDSDQGLTLCCRRRFRFRPDPFHRPARLLDRRARRPGRALDLERYRDLQFVVGEEPDAILLAADHARRLQRCGVDRRLRVEFAGIDRLLHPLEADLIVVVGKDVVEAALRQAPMERHLSAFKALYGDAGARLLPLDATAAGLALARADAAPDAHARLVRSRAVGDLVEFHPGIPHVSSTIRTRWLTLSIIPRTAGLSGSVFRRLILLRPSPIRVARCSRGRRIGLPVCSTVMDLLLLPFAMVPV